MAVVIRLRRAGKKKKPFYHIVAADSRCPRDGKHLEKLGTYNPLLGENQVTVDNEKVEKWLKTGARITDTVRNILKVKNAAQTMS